MRTDTTQLSFIGINSGSYTEREKQMVLRNLSLNNKEIAAILGRTEASVRTFLNKEQIRRSDQQREQISKRVGERIRGERNPNFKNWRSLDYTYYKHRSIAKYPERHRARVMLQNAIRRGEIIPKDFCERCSATDVRIESHHSSYEPGKELDVIYCCHSCHIILDNERRSREASEQNFYHENRCTDNSQKGL
jgi:hypothetical protein